MTAFRSGLRDTPRLAVGLPGRNGALRRLGVRLAPPRRACDHHSMSRRRFPLGLAFVTIAAAALALVLILTSHHPGNRIVNAVLVPLVGWSFAASGLVAWW